MSMKVFTEGKTEEIIVKKLDLPAEEIISADGKGNMNDKISNTLGPALGLKPLRVLVMRDLDRHEGETAERLRQGSEQMLKKVLKNRNLDDSIQIEQMGPNIFLFAKQEIDLRLCLHIADYQWSTSFIKSTIDDYVLAIALEPQIAQALAEKQKIADGPTLMKKITEELPQLLESNGILLYEAKDYIRLYAAILKMHTSPPVFTEKALANAEASLLQKHFSSLFAAAKTLQ